LASGANEPRSPNDRPAAGAIATRVATSAGSHSAIAARPSVTVDLVAADVVERRVPSTMSVRARPA
jgi:hypothetical protein